MRIYLDGMFFRCTGVGRVYENLLSMLLEDPALEIVHTAVPASEAGAFRNSFADPRIKPHFLPYAPMTVGDLARKTGLLRRVRDDVSLFYYPSHNVPLGAPEPFVVTVNDVTAFSPLFRVSWQRRLAFRMLLGRSIRRARRVVTISRTAERDLLALFPRAAGKTEVVYPWVDDRFFDIRRDPQAVAAPEKGYLLWLGLRIHHKNLEGLLAAFELLAPDFPELRLVLAGRRYAPRDMVDAWKARSPLANRVVEVIDPSDDEVARLLAGASVFVFPSLAEGFGLPPLEAMAVGVPVVCSDIPVFREVYGSAARFVDPTHEAAIAAGVRELLAGEVPSNARELEARARARPFGKATSGGRLRALFRDRSGAASRPKEAVGGGSGEVVAPSDRR